MANQCQHLTEAQRNELIIQLQKIQELFDGTLGNWKAYLLDSQLKYDAKPICSITYPVPKVHKEIFQNEVERLVPLIVLEIANNSEWGAPSFAQPKPKSK